MDKTKIAQDFKNKFQGSTAPVKILPYTGNNMLGITLVHKSGLQPIFSKEAAVDAANMRR